MTQGIEFTQEEKDELKRSIVDQMASGDGVTFTLALQLVGKPSRAVAYKWLAEDDEWAAEIANAREASHAGVTDLAQNQIIKMISAGDRKACTYWLDRRGRRQGFTPKIENTINLPGQRTTKISEVQTAEDAADAYQDMLNSTQTNQPA